MPAAAPHGHFAGVSVFLAERPVDPSQQHTSFIVLFYIFQLFGLFGGLITIFLALYSSVQRHATWYHFLISWIISSISFSLLLFGGQADSEEPDHGLCVLQSALIYAAPPLNAAATLGLVAQIWFNVHSTLVGGPFKGQRYWTWTILLLPYILFIGGFFEALGFGLANPSSIRKTGSGMFCNMGIPIPGQISAGLVVVVLIPVVVIEFIIVFSLRRNWGTFRGRGNTFSLIIRLFAFSIFGIFALGMSLFFFFTIKHGAALNLVVAVIPVVAILIFGTQRDLLEVLKFWKKSPSREEDLGLDSPPPVPEKDYYYDTSSDQWKA